MKKFILSLFVFLVTASVFAEKKAFIVAISDFKGGFSSISSQNDTFLLRKALTDQGFKIKVLYNKQATRAKIIDGLNKFTAGLNSGDVVFLHFSTHGRQVQDYSGDEIDGLDEAFVCYDSKMEGDKDLKTVVNTYLIDDTMERMVNSIRQKIGKNGDLLVSLDACHSGTGTRGMGIKRGGYAPLVDSADFVMKSRSVTKNDTYVSVANNDGLSPYVVYSGSQADVPNYEMNLPRSIMETLPNSSAGAGSLTYAFVTALAGIKNSPVKFTYNKLFEVIKVNMSELEKVQVPVTEGNGGDREIFGGDYVKGQPYFTIDKVNGNIVTLKSGTANKLYNGTKVYICPKGSQKPDVILGKATVSKEDFFKSTLTLDSSFTVPADALVFVYEQAFSMNKIKINLNAATEGFKKAILDRLPFLENTTNTPELIFSLVNGTKDCRIWKTKDSNSIFYNPHITNLNPEDDKGFDYIKDYLTDYFQYKNISSIKIENNDYKLEFEPLLISNKDTCRKCTEARRASGTLQLYSGDTIQFLVINKGPKPAFFNILDLQPDGKIGLLFTGKDQKLNSSDLFVTNYDRKLLKSPVTIGPPYGVDIFKLISFSIPEDLGDLQKNYASRGPGPKKGVSSLIRSSNKVSRGGTNADTTIKTDGTDESNGSTFEMPYIISDKPVQ